MTPEPAPYAFTLEGFRGYREQGRLRGDAACMIKPMIGTCYLFAKIGHHRRIKAQTVAGAK